MPWDQDLDPNSPSYGIASSRARFNRVIAGPGTGKSFALKRHVARILEEGADPERILPVTFTNVAAEDLQREMLRIGAPGCEDIRGSTLHSLCMRILSRENVLKAVGRTPRPLNKFGFHETTAMHEASASAARRGNVLTVLYEFTDRLQHAGSSAEVYELAMTAIIRALHCDRAAILLFDETGVMRFAASRDLSESYCRAVEGHSPWSADCTNAEPICANTVASADLPQSLKETLRSEGIAALAFIPLKEHGRLIGKFMVYHDSPHVFDVSEIEAGLAIARQLVFGLERRRAEEAVQRLATIVESSDDAIVSKNLDGIILTWNRGAERIFGYKAEEVIGQPVTVLIPPDRFDEEPGILARLRRGEPIDHYETIRRRKDGTLIDVSLTVSPVKDTTGRVIGASKIARDITERKRAEATLRDSARHLQNLLAASRRPSTQPTLPGGSRTTMRRRSNLPGGGRR